MKLSNLTRFLLLISSLTIIINTIHCMKIEPEKTAQKKKSRMKKFADRVGNILLGKNKETVEEILFIEFADLPSDIQYYIMSLLITNSSATTLDEAAITINSLAQINKEFNILFNNKQFTINIIDHLSQRFDVSPEETATALVTKEAQNYLKKQLTNKNFLYLQYPKLSNNNINVNVTNEHGNTPLMLAVTYLYQSAIDALLNNKNINLSLQNNDGDTVFHIALHRLKKAATDQEYTQIEQIIKNLLIKKQKHSHFINIQNNNGDTPLHIVLEMLQHQRNRNKTIAITNIASMMIDSGEKKLE